MWQHIKAKEICEAAVREVLVQVLVPAQRQSLGDVGRMVKGRTPKWMLLSPGERPAMAGNE